MDEIKNAIARKVCAVLAGASDSGASGAGVSYGDALSALEVPVDASMGDIALPCFRFSRTLKKAPAAIAKELCAALDGAFDGIESVRAVGGYLNFFLSPAHYVNLLEGMAADENFGSSDIGRGRTVCIDYSSPNIAKRFHVGHLGTTAIGGCLKKLHEFCGYKTVGINHLGDWGTQFGKLLVAYKKWSSPEKVEQRGISELAELYVRFSAEAERDGSLGDEARAAFAKLESGDTEYREIWQKFKDISLREYMKTYKLLNASFDSFKGESFYNDKTAAVVEELQSKGLLTEDGGAKVVRLDDFDMPPALILKKDGSTLYATRDIAAAIYRKKTYDFYKCLYVTSAGQSLHFRQYFKVLELMGCDWAKDLVHIPYGTMSVNGEKLASRTGNVILLDELFAEAIAKAEKIVEEKNGNLKNKRETAEAVGVGAVVFNTLLNGRIKDSNFVWEEALSFEGSTGPYVQYTYARASSVLRKAKEAPSAGAPSAAEAYLPGKEERAAIAVLSRFPERVLAALAGYEPSHIARFALEVCAAYNLFYHERPILKAEGRARSFRLCLTALTRRVLGSCLDLLGMKRTEEI